MTDSQIRQTRTVVFDEAIRSEERLAAVLITRDAEGRVKAYSKTISDRPTPDPEIVDVLRTSVEISNL